MRHHQSSSASSPANTDAAYGATTATTTHGSDPPRHLRHQHPPAIPQHARVQPRPPNGAALPSRIHCVFPDDPDTVYIVRRRDVRRLPPTVRGETVLASAMAPDQCSNPRFDSQRHHQRIMFPASDPDEVADAARDSDRGTPPSDLIAPARTVSSFLQQHHHHHHHTSSSGGEVQSPSDVPLLVMCRQFGVTTATADQDHDVSVNPAPRPRRPNSCPQGKRCPFAHVAIRAATPRFHRHVHPAMCHVVSAGTPPPEPAASMSAQQRGGFAARVAVVLSVCHAPPIATRGASAMFDGGGLGGDLASLNDGTSPRAIFTAKAFISKPANDDDESDDDDVHDGETDTDDESCRQTRTIYFLHRTAALPTRAMSHLFEQTAVDAAAPTVSAAVDHAAAPKSPPLLHHCAHWLRTGVCDFGADCRFVHSLVGLGAATPAEALAAVGESVPQPVHRGRRRFPFQHDPYDANTSSFRAASSADE